MTKKQIEELKDALYETNWYIDTRFGDVSQRRNAYDANVRALKIVTDGAYKGKYDGETDEEESPEIPDESSGIAVKPYSIERKDWAYSGSTFPAVIVGLTPEEFRGYVQWVRKNEKYNWNPTGITAHHTAWPNLDAPHHWKNGWTKQLIKNARGGYIRDRGFRHGPHIFSDQNKIWIMNPLSIRGTHASSFNHTRYGVEMLLDGENQKQIDSEKGQASLRMGHIACAILMKDGGISKSRLNFHRDDKKTSKQCPGSLIDFHDYEAKVHAIYDSLS